MAGKLILMFLLVLKTLMLAISRLTAVSFITSDHVAQIKIVHCVKASKRILKTYKKHMKHILDSDATHIEVAFWF